MVLKKKAKIGGYVYEMLWMYGSSACLLFVLLFKVKDIIYAIFLFVITHTSEGYIQTL